MDTAPKVIIDDSASDPNAGIWFAVPGGFRELPIDALLAGPGSTEADRLRQAVATLVETLPDGVTSSSSSPSWHLDNSFFAPCGRWALSTAPWASTATTSRAAAKLCTPSSP
ncbi:hypothetical protein ABZ357_14480 [Streptomyces sp. NPDC005917]|uniref:hypothetical protein n=1 Tax=unclassified Streptomyces TaxID=2593676 RepID=UPI0033C363C7